MNCYRLVKVLDFNKLEKHFGVLLSLHMIGPGMKAPEIVNAVVEIPYGSRIKYEIDHITNLVKVDRVLYSPIHYPAEYGYIPHTLADDKILSVALNDPNYAHICEFGDLAPIYSGKWNISF